MPFPFFYEVIFIDKTNLHTVHHFIVLTQKIGSRLPLMRTSRKTDFRSRDIAKNNFSRIDISQGLDLEPGYNHIYTNIRSNINFTVIMFRLLSSRGGKWYCRKLYVWETFHSISKSWNSIWSESQSLVSVSVLQSRIFELLQ